MYMVRKDIEREGAMRDYRNQDNPNKIKAADVLVSTCQQQTTRVVHFCIARSISTEIKHGTPGVEQPAC
jgi:hypothetical protein